MSSLRQIASSGKGDIGKSTTFKNRLGVLLDVGQKMLVVGCDPKIGSTRPIAARDRAIWSGRVNIPGHRAATTTSATTGPASRRFGDPLFRHPPRLQLDAGILTAMDGTNCIGCCRCIKVCSREVMCLYGIDDKWSGCYG